MLTRNLGRSEESKKTHLRIKVYLFYEEKELYRKLNL